MTTAAGLSFEIKLTDRAEEKMVQRVALFSAERQTDHLASVRGPASVRGGTGGLSDDVWMAVVVTD